MTQLALSDVGVEFGATTLFEKVTFTVAAGERWGVIGRNGSGKTTLFRLLTGQMQPPRGQIARQPGLRVTLLEQHRDFGDAKTVWDAVAGGLAELRALEAPLAGRAAARPAAPSAPARGRAAAPGAAATRRRGGPPWPAGSPSCARSGRRGPSRPPRSSTTTPRR